MKSVTTTRRRNILSQFFPDSPSSSRYGLVRGFKKTEEVVRNLLYSKWCCVSNSWTVSHRYPTSTMFLDHFPSMIYPISTFFCFDVNLFIYGCETSTFVPQFCIFKCRSVRKQQIMVNSSNACVGCCVPYEKIK